RLNTRFERRSERRVKRTKALADYGDIVSVNVGPLLKHIKNSPDDFSPFVGNRKFECCLALAWAIDCESCHSAAHKSIAPCMELFFASIQPWQQDRDCRALDALRPAQIPDQRRACVRNSNPFNRWIEAVGGGLIALHDALVRD